MCLGKTWATELCESAQCGVVVTSAVFVVIMAVVAIVLVIAEGATGSDQHEVKSWN